MMETVVLKIKSQIYIFVECFLNNKILPNNEEEYQFLFQLDISLWYFDQENHQQQNYLRMLFTVEGGRPS